MLKGVPMMVNGGDAMANDEEEEEIRFVTASAVWGWIRFVSTQPPPNIDSACGPGESFY